MTYWRGVGDVGYGDAFCFVVVLVGGGVEVEEYVSGGVVEKEGREGGEVCGKGAGGRGTRDGGGGDEGFVVDGGEEAARAGVVEEGLEGGGEV